MKTLELTTTAGRGIIVNLDNVTLIKESCNNFGEDYVEVHFTGGKTADVQETIDVIRGKLSLDIASKM